MTSSALIPQEVEALLHLNRQLRQVEQLIDHAHQQSLQRLSAKACSPDDPMRDFEIDAEIDYVLRKDDPAWQEDSDNILTSRRINLSRGKRATFRQGDCCEDHPHLQAIHGEPHCYLFHDLYDHDYGPAHAALSFQDCVRIGEIWIDVVIRQQYVLTIGTVEMEQGND